MPKKPRILYIATFPPPIHGSAIVSEQIRNSKVINSAFEGDYVNLATSRSLDESKNYILKLWRFSCSFIKTFFLLLTRKYNLCYCAITCYGGCFLRDAPFVLLCKLFRMKIVIHQHNKGMSSYVDKPLFRWLYPLVYRNTKVILLSWHLYPDIEKIVKRDDVLICPNGIKPTINANELSKIKRDTNSIPHILFLSNLLIDKGVFVLLDALKILKDKGYSFVCDFVGGETNEINAQLFYEEVGKRKLNEIALYHGSKYGNEKEKFWNHADIFTLPSFNEAFPLVNIEAMEHKLPIVSTNVGGIPDEVNNGNNGLVITPRNADVLADALKKLLDDPQLRRKMGDKGYEIFIQRFTAACFENNLTELLNKVNRAGGF